MKGKARLPPAEVRPPIPASVSSVEIDPLADIRRALQTALPSHTERTQSVQSPSRFSGRAVTYGPTDEALIDAALLQLDAVEAAIAAQDADAAAVRSIELAALLCQIESANILKPLLAGIGTMKGGGQTPPRYTADEIVVALNQAHRDHPRRNLTALRSTVGKKLQLSVRQIIRITKYDPR